MCNWKRITETFLCVTFLSGKCYCWCSVGTQITQSNCCQNTQCDRYAVWLGTELSNSTCLLQNHSHSNSNELLFVQIHSGNNSKMIFLWICICYEIRTMSEIKSICYAVPLGCEEQLSLQLLRTSICKIYFVCICIRYDMQSWFDNNFSTSANSKVKKGVQTSHFRSRKAEFVAFPALIICPLQA